MHTRLEAIDGNKTKLIVIANVVWDKQTILKSKIETETINGMKKYYDVVEKELISSISEPGKCQNFTSFWKYSFHFLTNIYIVFLKASRKIFLIYLVF